MMAGDDPPNGGTIACVEAMTEVDDPAIEGITAGVIEDDDPAVGGIMAGMTEDDDPAVRGIKAGVTEELLEE